MGPQQNQFYLPQQPTFVPYLSYNPFGQVVPQFSQTPPQPQQTVAQTQQPQIQQLRARIVANEDEIAPNEVSMDGSVTLFLKNDLSCIYGKTWAKDGTIKTLVFPAQVESAVNEAQAKEDQAAFNADLLTNVVQQVVQDQMENMFLPKFDELTKLITEQKKPSNLIV